MKDHHQLEWNLGGWLGVQLGGSVWILLAGALTLSKNTPVGLSVLALFAVANGIGWALWRYRKKRSAYTAIQLLLPVLGVCGAGAVWLLDRANVYETMQHGGTISASSTYLLLLVLVPGLMLMFYLRFGRHKQGK